MESVMLLRCALASQLRVLQMPNQQQCVVQQMAHAVSLTIPFFIRKSFDFVQMLPSLAMVLPTLAQRIPSKPKILFAVPLPEMASAMYKKFALEVLLPARRIS